MRLYLFVLRAMLAFILLVMTLTTLVLGVEARPRYASDLQRGLVSETMNATGCTIMPVEYPVPYQEPPFLLASPRGQGSLAVATFQANSLTGVIGSIAVCGTPGALIEFTWLAVP